jgi:hypothetical protein
MLMVGECTRHKFQRRPQVHYTFSSQISLSFCTFCSIDWLFYCQIDCMVLRRVDWAANLDRNRTLYLNKLITDSF